jgi:hypothetical protein
MPLTESTLKTYLDAATWGAITKPTTIIDDRDNGVGECLWIQLRGKDKIRLVGNNIYTRARSFELTYLTANSAGIDTLESLLKAYTGFKINGIEVPERNQPAAMGYLISIIRFTMTNFEV